MNAPRPALAIIPSAITATSLLLGFAGIVAAAEGHWHLTAWAVVWCVLLDIADGTLARRLGAGTAVGAQLDSLADLVAFGVAPAMLVYRVSLDGAPTLIHTVAVAGGCAALLLAAAYRLARFNAASAGAAFTGLPAPIGALILASTALVVNDTLSSPQWNAALPVLAIGIAGLMVSRVSFARLDGAGRSWRRRVLQICLFAVVASALSMRFPGIVLACALVYLVIAGGPPRPATGQH
ncbi:CDP-alcohol phosphatidyltransferase family protein [Arhodomonas sp. AD133]|uniref:CDP-alcohol phosphatidyltransferase family protein n=1 Tax=Arhodomonas sp. AD133 TaxID=3415009 RepID=UPI003EB9490B